MLCLATTIGIGAMQIHKTSEVNRVKNYIDDLTNEENYVDLSRVSFDYDIKDFEGKYLRLALEQSDVDYVVIDDTIIYNGDQIGTFKIVDSINDVLIGYDDNNEPVYEGKSVAVNNIDGKFVYEIPEGYHLREIDITAGAKGPYKYEVLDNYHINVVEDYGAYGLSLSKHK